MKDIWNTLEERTRAWPALERQNLANALWADYVTFRFGRTGDPRALQFLYPYLNHADRQTRLRAITVAARIFEGRGTQVLPSLDYFTKNIDLFLQDRAVQVIGAAVTGAAEQVILDVLAPYLNSRNQFIRKQAFVALGRAAAGQASQRILDELRRVVQTSGPRQDEVDLAIATVFAGRPTEEVYGLLVRPELASRIDTNNEHAAAVLVRGASETWYARAYEDVFKPRLHTQNTTWERDFIEREGISSLAYASPGRGMDTLERMLHLRGFRPTGHCMMLVAPGCFAGADVEANRGPLIKLAEEGDVPAQRIAAVCLGGLTMGMEDAETLRVLRKLCEATSKSAQAAALAGIGVAAKSACNEDVQRLCLDHVADPETAVAATRALGMTYLGSARSDVFKQLTEIEERYRTRPVRGRKHCKPLSECYSAVGLLYLGTGSEDPVNFLLDVLARPPVRRYNEYHWRAARALVETEFSETVMGGVA